MAIEQTILCAVAPSFDDVLILKNINQKYAAYENSINSFE
jgi:hypothetical protein